jgi:hypothetical protein
MMKNNRLAILSYIAVAALTMLIALLVTTTTLTNTTAAQTPPPMNNQNVNFTKLIEERIGEPILADLYAQVIYQSPKTVILEGDSLALPQQGMGLVSNQYLWKAVDLLKEHGYQVDSVLTSGLSTANNPLCFM